MSEQVTWKLDENNNSSTIHVPFIPGTTVTIHQPNGEVIETHCGQFTLPAIAGNFLSGQSVEKWNDIPLCNNSDGIELGRTINSREIDGKIISDIELNDDGINAILNHPIGFVTGDFSIDSSDQIIPDEPIIVSRK